MRVIAEALTLADETGERFYTAELFRLKGELLLQQVPADVRQAEICFERALDISRHQGTRGTRALELRAATSLARLCHEQARTAQAREILAPIYGWFTEGLDTQDLKEAKALLDRLG